MRNAACTAVAPTGSISIIAGCSSGIEPVYSLATTHRALDGQEFFEMHPLLERMGQEQGWLTNAVRQALARGDPTATLQASAVLVECRPAHKLHGKPTFQGNRHLVMAA